MDPGCFDVFISHSGEQKELALHISNAIAHNGGNCVDISVFVDEPSLEPGQQAWDMMAKAAESDQLSVGVILLSPDYVTKDWPMRELGILLRKHAERLDSRDRLHLIPVFAYTEADDCFQDDYIERMLQSKPHRQQAAQGQLSTWKENLANLAQNCGVRRDVVPKGLDGLLVSHVAKNVMDILQRKLGKLAMPQHAQDLESLVAPIVEECVRVYEDTSSRRNLVLIHGMGGSGKTTQAKCLFNDDGIRSRYCKLCYLSVGQAPDLANLQEELLVRLCGLRNVGIRNEETGLALLRDRLRGIKAFIVLDNVWSQEALDHLVVDMAPGSCVVVTARRQDFRGDFRQKFNVHLLGPASALELFSNFAGVTEPSPEDTTLLKEVALLCDGLPLALKTTGSLVKQKMNRHNSRRQSLAEACAHISKQLKDVGHLIGDDQMQKSLMISYNALADDFNEDKAQVMFVNIAVFCKEKTTRHIVTWHCNVLYSDTDDTHDRLQLLIDLHLVEENKQKGLVSLHDQLAALAVNLCTTHLSHGGVKSISSMFIRGEPKREDARELHLLCKRNIGGFEYLRNMCWDELPQGQAVRAMYIIRKAPELQVLRFDNSTATQLDLCDPAHPGPLEELQLLSLQDCVALTDLRLPPTMGELRVLDLSGCVALGSLDNLPLDSFSAFASLDVSGCISLRKLPENLGKVTTLRELHACNSGLQSLPASTTQLVDLRHLRLACCPGLTQLPRGLLQSCTHLEELDIRGSGLPNIPQDVKYLKKLKCLSFTDSNTVETLPDEITELESLEFLLINMNHKLRRLPTGIDKLTKLQYLDFSFCKELQLTEEDNKAIRSLPHIPQSFKDKLDDERKWRTPHDTEFWAETEVDVFYWRSVNRSGIMPLVKSLLNYRDLPAATVEGLLNVLYLNVNTEDNRWAVIKAGGLRPLFDMLVEASPYAGFVEAALKNMSVSYPCHIFSEAVEHCMQTPAAEVAVPKCCRLKALLGVLQYGRTWAFHINLHDPWRSACMELDAKSQLQSSAALVCHECRGSVWYQ